MLVAGAVVPSLAVAELHAGQPTIGARAAKPTIIALPGQPASRGYVALRAGCRPPCAAVRARGELRVGRRKRALRAVTRSVRGVRALRMKLRLPRSARKRVCRALAARWRVSVSVRVESVGASGAALAFNVRTIRLLSPPKRRAHHRAHARSARRARGFC
jgi:hypothetical protein